MCNGKNNQFDSKIQEMPSVMADYSSSFSSAGLGGGGVRMLFQLPETM